MSLSNFNIGLKSSFKEVSEEYKMNENMNQTRERAGLCFFFFPILKQWAK